MEQILEESLITHSIQIGKAQVPSYYYNPILTPLPCIDLTLTLRYHNLTLLYLNSKPNHSLINHQLILT